MSENKINEPNNPSSEKEQSDPIESGNSDNGNKQLENSDNIQIDNELGEHIIEQENINSQLNFDSSDNDEREKVAENENNTENDEFERNRKNEKPMIPEDHYYDYENLFFKPIISEESNLKNNLVQMYHSFGYDCKKRSNLNILDPETLIFSAGNMVQILNMKTKKQSYLRTTSGGGVGAITVHPSRQFFAVGEKGNTPNINVFEYPSLKLYRILRQGTVKGYSHLDFNVQGDLLASLGGSPDFTLTLWDWRQESIVLRTKAFSQDVYKVTFSKDLKGVLTTAGTGHIKFWKMANTFTGFKLQGELGKFGKTEISDIDGYAELPDGKVLSGCEWGNMLLWDGGLIQTEICRKKNKPCHIGSIQQITLDEGDIYTIGEDGTVRVWDFETVDTAEPSDEGTKLELEPLNELSVGKNVALKSMIKDSAEESTLWYAQDSNGGIWRLDLSFGASSEYPKQIFNYHSGIINGMDTCPNSHLLATTADDGSIKIYNYLTYEIAVQRKFNRGGSHLKWMPVTIDAGGSTILVGFKDGVLRCFKIIFKENQPNKDLFELIEFEVFKPHTQSITSIVIDSKAELLATGSDDNTVFFFRNRKNQRTPIGFVKLPSAVTYMCWTPEEYKQNRLLVCMKDGSVYEYDAPSLDGYDVSKTYLIEMKLNCRKYKFKSIKSRLRHEEELERKRLEEEEKKKKEAEERRLRGLDDVEDKSNKKETKDPNKEDPEENSTEEQSGEKKQKEDEEKSDEQKKEDEWKPYLPDIPSKILWAVYSTPDSFWLSMDDFDAGYMYECKFLTIHEKTRITVEKIDEPIFSISVLNSDLTHSEDIPLSCVTFNKSKTFVLIGQKNGVLRCQPMPDSKSLKDLKHFWSYGFHDNEYGHVTNVCLSFDERFIFSSGADSNIFGCLFNTSVEALEQAKIESIRVENKQSELVEIADIDDPNAYSIEQAKQKSEYDKMMANAESKKQDMRQKVYQLRKTFKELLNKNEQLIPRLKLNKEDFMLEESIKEQVLSQIDEKINLTYRELAWFSEKCRLSLEKIKSRFKDVIDYEHLVLFTFDGSQHVSTFRTVQLPKDIEEFETELVKQYTIHLMEKQKTKESQENQGVNDKEKKFGETEQGINSVDQIKKIFGKLHGNTAARVERALKKMEEKKQKRIKRKKEWEDLLNHKLPADYENPEDVSAIKDAEENLGDFKLKTGENYIVPEEQRMNVFKATKRLIAIKQILHKNQVIFNQRVFNLRDRKVVLVEEINRNIDRLEEIKRILSQESFEIPTRPKMIIEEQPEKQFNYNKEKLIEFKKELESKVGNAEKSGHEEEAGLGGFASGAASTKKINTSEQINPSTNSNNYHANSKFDEVKPLWLNRDSMSYLMKKRAQVEEIKLFFEQQQLLRSINDKMTFFSAEVKMLRHEKGKVSILNKNIDLRHVTLYEEFMLLRDFEKTENELEQKLEKRKEEHLEAQSKMNEIQTKIDLKRKDIEKLDEKQKELLNTYHHMTQDESKFSDFLTKVYKRKIKRKKKTEGAEEDEESEEESEESDSEDEDEDEDDEGSEAEGREQLDLDMCPNGLNQELYDQVCQLREKRLDLEELQAEEKKILEQFKKDQEGAVKRAKVVENTLKQAQQELQNFQKEKQKKINNLDIIVTLRFDQIHFMDKGYLPVDLIEALVFDSKNLDRLQERIKELQNEKVNEKKRFKQLKQRHLELIRDKKKMEDYIEKLEESSNKMMLDKFGKIVDLEKLELIAVNQQIEELKQRMAENEFEHEKVMQEWLSKINNEKDESIELLKANTSRINEIVDIIQESKKLDKFLNSKQKSLGEEFSGVSKKDLDEQERLHTLVQLQAQEIEALKAEISILSRKGGHILPPNVPPTTNQLQTTL